MNRTAAAPRARGWSSPHRCGRDSALTIDGWVSFNNAVLTESFPQTAASPDCPAIALPNSSRWSGNLSVREEFPMCSNRWDSSV